MKMPDVDYLQYLNDISYLEAPKIKDITEFHEQYMAELKYGNKPSGPTLPWSKTHDCTRINDGKLSIWAGENGSGKSLLLGQVITHLMLQGRKAVIASLEMKPEQTMARMTNQAATCSASQEYGNKWIANFLGQLYIYDELDRVKADRILGMAYYAANVLGAKDVVIDSLTKCGVGREDYTAQAAFVDRLQWCAKQTNIHIHLVCHMRKRDENHRAGKNDIRGAAEITDLADNVFILRRNKQKEVELEKQFLGMPFDQKIVSQPCAYLCQQKNRDYGEEKDFSLWYHKPSGCFTAGESIKPRPLEL